VFGGRKSWFAAALGLTVLGLGGLASTASATFHLIKVREVFPGTVAQPESDYVELQMFASLQTQVQEGQLRIYNSNGTTASTFQPSVPVAGGESNSTVLIADSAFGTQFPGVTADFTDSSLDLSPAGGAVCWPVNSFPIDCASWGTFSGNVSLPSSAGSPFQGSGASGAIADGKAIIRSISAGCPTFLDASDDSDNSAADFSEAIPNPRPNSSPVTEMPCATTGNPTSPINPAGNVRKRKCKKHKASATPSPAPAYSAKKHKCKKKKRR
jgi:hypothetical protein